MKYSSVANKVQEILEEKRIAFLRTLKPQRVSFRKMCSKWRWARRSDVYTHQIHRYPAKLLPYIPLLFLSCPYYASQKDIVLDPFAGTGTVLLESIIHPYFKRNSVGIEINPLARLIAKVKTTPLDADMLTKIAEKLMNRIQCCSDKIEIPEFTNRDFWFSKHVQIQLAKIRNCIEEIEIQDYRDFFWVCFSSIIRTVSFADPSIPPPVLLKVEKFKANIKRKKKVEQIIKQKEKAEPFSYFKQAVARNIKRIKNTSEIPEILSKSVKAEIIWDDARTPKWGKLRERGMIDKSKCRPIKDESIGLVITSPPYISAQKYIRTTKLELLWLGIVNKNELLKIDAKTIGTERVYKNEYRNFVLPGLPVVDTLIDDIYKTDPKRACIVSKYFVDMQKVMTQIYRILKRDGRFILVVGNNRVCGKLIENHNLLSEIGVGIGFDVEMILVDEIRSRGMITKRHESGGLMLDEWVIVLRKEG